MQIKNVAKALNIKISQICEETGFTKTEIKEFDNNTRDASLDDLFRLSMAMGINMRDFFTNEFRGSDGSNIATTNTLSYYIHSDNDKILDIFFGYVSIELNNDQKVIYPITYHNRMFIIDQIRNINENIHFKKNNEGEPVFIAFQTLNNKLVRLNSDGYKKITFVSTDSFDEPKGVEFFLNLPTDHYKIIKDILEPTGIIEDNYSEETIEKFTKIDVVKKILSSDDNINAFLEHCALRVINENNTVIEYTDCHHELGEFFYNDSDNCLNLKPIIIRHAHDERDTTIIPTKAALLIEAPLYTFHKYCDEIDYDSSTYEEESFSVLFNF